MPNFFYPVSCWYILGVDSTLGLLWIKLLWTFLYKSFTHYVFLGKNIGMELLSIGDVYVSQKLSNNFPKCLSSFILPWAVYMISVLLYILASTQYCQVIFVLAIIVCRGVSLWFLIRFYLVIFHILFGYADTFLCEVFLPFIPSLLVLPPPYLRGTL